MTDFSSPSATAIPLFVSSCGQYGPIQTLASLTGAAPGGSARTWVAKLVCYIPVVLPFPYPVHRVFWINGSTSTSTNVDFGIYSKDGVRIYNTGSTVMGTASTVQYVTPASPMVLVPAQYYFAWTCDNTTSRAFAPGGSANNGRMCGLLEETTGSFGLPATMTPVAWARAFGPSVCGVTRTTTGF